MKRNLALFILTLGSMTATGLYAGDPKDAITPTIAPETNMSISQEFLIEGAYDGGSSTKQGDHKIGSVDDAYSHFNYVVSPQIQEGVLLRFGVDAERNSFGLPNSAPLPNTLQSVNAVIGADFAVNDQILLRAELHPGIYSDFVHVTSSDFDMPVQIGGTYLWSKDFQLIFGVQIDLKSDLPIIALPGFRWQFADQWVISAIPPKPQLQYLLNKSVTLYTGAELIGGTYRVNNTFGNNHGHGDLPGTANLNGNIVDFAEVRLGVGVTYKVTPELSLDVSGGYMPYREFDFHPDQIGFADHNTTFHNNLSNGAPYGEVGLSGSF